MKILNSKFKIILLVLVLAGLMGLVWYFRGNDSSAGALWNLSQGGKWLLPLVAVSALIDSINPCAFSVLLLTIAFLFSLGRLRENILKIGLTYIFGLFAVYLLIGLGIVQTLHFFNTPNFMAKLGAALLVALGSLNLVNHFFPKFPLKIRLPQVVHHRMARYMEKGSLPAAFLLGGLVGICEFPCTGGPYLMVLGLLHDQATYLKGFSYLLLYNLIFVLPLFVILFLASNTARLERVQAWQRQEKGAMRLWSGLAMIALGIVIFLI